MRRYNVRTLGSLIIAPIAAAALLAGCSHPALSPAIPAGAASDAAAATRRAKPSFVASDKIKHIVFIIQENRTFDNIFGGSSPFPGADAATHGQTSDGRNPALDPIGLESTSAFSSQGDTNNYHLNWLLACNPLGNGPPYRPFPVGMPSPCQMNGFNLNAETINGQPPPPGVTEKTIYSYINRTESKPYWDIAKAYALGDRFFMGHNSESFTGHQYLFSGQSNKVADSPVYPTPPQGPDCAALNHYCAYVPWGCDSPLLTATYTIDDTTGLESATPTGGFPCFGLPGQAPYHSMADLADKKKLSWTVYAQNMCSSIIGLDVNYGTRNSGDWAKQPDWVDCYNNYGPLKNGNVNTAHFRTPSYAFFPDEKAGKSKRDLASITWILPGPFNSDHPGVPHGFCGPTWVAELLDSIGANQSDWDSTVIFITWDDWGGFYDHVPPYIVRDQRGPGFRVPLLVVSPYVRPHTVVHTNIEFATLLKFTEQTLGLGTLGGAATDSAPNLNNLNDFFDFNAPPHAFTPISPTYTQNPWCSGSRPLDAKKIKARWLNLDGDD